MPHKVAVRRKQGGNFWDVMKKIGKVIVDVGKVAAPIAIPLALGLGKGKKGKGKGKVGRPKKKGKC